jgi:hypothetical protein
MVSLSRYCVSSSSSAPDRSSSVFSHILIPLADDQFVDSHLTGPKEATTSIKSDHFLSFLFHYAHSILTQPDESFHTDVLPFPFPFSSSPSSAPPSGLSTACRDLYLDRADFPPMCHHTRSRIHGQDVLNSSAWELDEALFTAFPFVPVLPRLTLIRRKQLSKRRLLHSMLASPEVLAHSDQWRISRGEQPLAVKLGIAGERVKAA